MYYLDLKGLIEIICVSVSVCLVLMCMVVMIGIIVK